MCLDEKRLREKLYRNQTPTTKFEMIGREIFAGSVDHHLQRNLISKVWLLGFNLIITKKVQFGSNLQYSKFGSANFGSQCTNFQLEFFDDLNFFGILPYHIHNEILILKGFDQFYC